MALTARSLSNPYDLTSGQDPYALPEERLPDPTTPAPPAPGPNPSPSPTPTPPPTSPPAPTTGNYGPYFGWDTTKLNDLTYHDPKYDFLRYVLDNNISPDAARGHLGDIWGKLGYGGSSVGDDSWNLGSQYGGTMDMIQAPDAHGVQHFIWIPAGGGGGTPTSSTQSMGSGANLTSATGTSATSSAPPTTTANQPLDLNTVANGGVFPDPTQQIGQDPLSQLTSDVLGTMLLSGGDPVTPFGHAVQGTLLNTLQNGGNNPLQFAQAREAFDRARIAQLNQSRADLANRGLLSEPGIQQGPELSAMQRIEQNLAPVFSGAVRDYMINNYNQALNAATGLAGQEQGNVLNTIKTVTDRQGVLSDIALRTLEQNRLFNQFLAQYSLDRDKVLADLASGQDSALLLLLQQYIATLNSSASGQVPPE